MTSSYLKTSAQPLPDIVYVKLQLADNVQHNIGKTEINGLQAPKLSFILIGTYILAFVARELMNETSINGRTVI